MSSEELCRSAGGPASRHGMAQGIVRGPGYRVLCRMDRRAGGAAGAVGPGAVGDRHDHEAEAPRGRLPLVEGDRCVGDFQAPRGLGAGSTREGQCRLDRSSDTAGMEFGGRHRDACIRQAAVGPIPAPSPPDMWQRLSATGLPECPRLATASHTARSLPEPGLASPDLANSGQPVPSCCQPRVHSNHSPTTSEATEPRCLSQLGVSGPPVVRASRSTRPSC